MVNDQEDQTEGVDVMDNTEGVGRAMEESSERERMKKVEKDIDRLNTAVKTILDVVQVLNTAMQVYNHRITKLEEANDGKAS